MDIAIQELQIFFFRLCCITVIVSIISSVTLIYGCYWLSLRVYSAQLIIENTTEKTISLNGAVLKSLSTIYQAVCSYEALINVCEKDQQIHLGFFVQLNRWNPSNRSIMKRA
jgi:hypothetical protein